MDKFFKRQSRPASPIRIPKHTHFEEEKEDDDDDEEELIFHVKSTKTSQTQQHPQTQETRETQTETETNLETEFTEPPFDYISFRNIYKLNDYVPTRFIKNIISHHFPTDASVMHEYTDTTKLLKIKICDLFPNKIENWKQNREPDYVRIPAIAKNIYQTKTNPIKTMFYMNYNLKTDKFELIDGCHRFKALEMLLSLNENQGRITDPKLKNENNDDIAEWFTNHDIDWLLNEYVIIYICFSSSMNDLEMLRENINLSQPMRYNAYGEKYQVINQIADNYQLKYKKNFSESDNETYLKSNGMTNRNKFIELLNTVYDKYICELENVAIHNRYGIIQQYLIVANENIYYDIIETRIKCNEKTRKRCDETGCYLFVCKNNVLENII